MNAVFITGTDTGSGKTVISTALALSLQKQGVNVGVVKPVETGVDEVPEDTLHFKNVLQLPDSLSDICPVQLKLPLAPLIAAEHEAKVIDYHEILNHCRFMAEKKDFLLIEGAGGILVPITQEKIMVDIPIDLKLSIIIVVGNKLGAINHSLLTIHYALDKKLNILALIMNSLNKEQSVAEETNIGAIKRFTNQIPVIEYPYLDNPQDPLAYHDIDQVTKLLISNKTK